MKIMIEDDNIVTLSKARSSEATLDFSGYEEYAS